MMTRYIDLYVSNLPSSLTSKTTYTQKSLFVLSLFVSIIGVLLLLFEKKNTKKSYYFIMARII